MLRALIICSLISISVSAHGELNLKAVHPDEDIDYTYNQRFSAKQSLDSLGFIHSALDSFRQLTETAANKISKDQLEEIGNTGWEMQNLGFPNHVQGVKGTLLKQEYLIHKLKYELAQIKLKTGDINQKEFLEIEVEYNKSEKQFQEFWNSFHISD
jgi:hypothetical protein